MAALRTMITCQKTQPSWHEYKRRRRWFFIVLLTYLPGVALVGYPLRALVGFDVFAVVACFWLLVFTVVSVRMNSFPCPKCHRPFFYRFPVSNPLTGECMRCGFPKWGEVKHESRAA